MPLPRNTGGTPVPRSCIVPLRAMTDTTLPPMPPMETPRTRLAGLILALLLALGFLGFTLAFDPPAHGGVDENGYLTGGKLLAQHGTMVFRPVDPSGKFDPFQFVGRMWVAIDAGTDRERYVPKYPAGYPLLVAIAWRLGGTAGAYWVNPLAMAGAVLGTFFLGRRLAGTLPGLLAAAAFATSLTTTQCATDPNSHATAACCGVWGLYGLLVWQRGGGGSGGVRRRAGAGVCGDHSIYGRAANPAAAVGGASFVARAGRPWLHRLRLRREESSFSE